MTVEQLYHPAVRLVLETDTQGLPMVVWLGDTSPPAREQRMIAYNLAHLLSSTPIVDNDAA